MNRLACVAIPDPKTVDTVALPLPRLARRSETLISRILARVHIGEGGEINQNVVHLVAPPNRVPRQPQ